MSERITYVGLDIHKKTIAVAMLLPDTCKALEWNQGGDMGFPFSNGSRPWSGCLKPQCQGN